ncbi:MAG: monovalent cation:proton antiporter-2 (CPA2) family protein [Alphaproteobacteria bacterium]
MEQGALRDVITLLIAGIVLVFVFQRIKAGPILGYLAAGILIGPHGFELIKDEKGMHALAELGVVFLLFSIGLELSFKRLAAMRGEVFGLGTAQVLLCGLAIGGIALLLGASVPAAAVIGISLAMSSTPIVLQTLTDRGELASRLGRTSFSILLLQDLAAVPLIALVPLLGGEMTADWSDVGITLLKVAGALAAIVIAGRLLLQPLLRQVASLHSPEIFVAITLLVILGTAWATYEVKLSLTLGAFLAGLLLAETEFRHQIEVDIKPFQGLLLGLFFITIGLGIDLKFAMQYWWQVLAGVVALVLIKASIIAGLCYLIKRPPAVAVRVGLLMAHAGEFAFVLVTLAKVAGVIPEQVAQVCFIIVAVSMMSTPIAGPIGKWFEARLQRSVAIGLAALESENIDLQDHVIIAGYGRYGRILARSLEQHRIPYVALDLNPQRVAEAKEQGRPIFYGDVSRPELLWGVGIDRARALVVTTKSHPESMLRLVQMVHNRLPDLKIVARVRDTKHAEEVMKAGAIAAVPDAVASGLHLAQSVLRAFELPTGDLSRMIAEYRAPTA